MNPQLHQQKAFNPNPRYMKDCLPSLCFKCVIVIGNGKIIQHRTSGAYSCSGESLYFKLPSFDKLFAWHWPFLGFASLHFSFVFLYLLLWTNCICCVSNLQHDDKCLAWQCPFQPWLSLIAAINIFLSFSRPFPSTWTNWNVWIWFTFCS